MTMKRWYIIGLLLILVVMIGGWSIAKQQQKQQAGMNMANCPNCPMMNQPMGMNPQMGGRNQMMMWERMAKELELSPEQKKQIETILLENKKAEIKLRSDLEIQRIELLMLFKNPKSTDEKIKETAKKIGGIQAALEEAKIDGILKAKKILSPEQQEKAIDLFMQMRPCNMGMGRAGMQPPMMGQGMMRGQMMGRGMMMQPGMGMMRQQMMNQQMDSSDTDTENSEDTETK
ncbi:MAG: Spy/CpxP family protein refolding chaperone [bacterium]